MAIYNDYTTTSGQQFPATPNFPTCDYMSAEIDKLAEALSTFQGSVKQPKLNKDVSVEMKAGGKYTFKYATLSACMEAAAPALKESGLAVTQLVNKTKGELVTVLMHKSGQYVTSVLPLNLNQNYQALGSAITYLKRYSYCAILGIVADDDDDANGAMGNTVATNPPRPAYTEAQLEDALRELEQCNSRKEVAELWAKWNKLCPAMTANDSAFYKAVAKKEYSK